MNNTICIDAGPVIQLVAFPENSSIQQTWEDWEKQGLTIAAPALLYYEVTNVLHRYLKYGILSSGTMQTLLLAALSLPVQLVEDPELHIRAAAIAQDYNLPAAYDAHYLALAKRLETELWTIDQKLLSRLKDYNIDWVRLVPSR